MKQLTKPICLGVFWALAVLDGLLLALRLHTRIKIHRTLRNDDFALILAFAILLAGGGTYVWMIDTFVELLPFEEGYATAETPFPPLARRLGVLNIIFDIMFVTSNWSVKLSFLLFLRRVLLPIPGYMKFWWMCFTAWALLLLGNYLSVIWLCKDTHNLISPESQCNTPADRRTLFGILGYSCGSDIMIDLLILILPFPLISQLKRISRRQKVGLYCVFSLAFVTIGLAAFRIAYQLGGTTYNQNHMTGYFITWLECLISILMGCIPGLVPIMRRRSSPPATVPAVVNDEYKDIAEARQRQAKRKSRDPWDIPSWIVASSRRGSTAPQLNNDPMPNIVDKISTRETVSAMHDSESSGDKISVGEKLEFRI